jgi:hypothetical protein
MIGVRCSLLTGLQFYRLLMEFSPQFHVAGLLHEYLEQDTFVPGFVREQLITNEQKDKITEALRKVRKEWRSLDTNYDRFANFSSLDWYDENEVDQVTPMIRRAMFDLMLGDETRRIHLNRYQEVHTVRDLIHAFFVGHIKFLHPRCEQESLWWDEIQPDNSPRKPWVSPDVAGNVNFSKLVFSWSTDSSQLQQWLRDYEQKGILKNNRLEGDVGVFSGDSAAAIVGFAKV